VKRPRLLALGASMAMAATAVPALPAAAASMTFTVTKTADTADGTCNADCSLREAITAANANPGHDTIVLPAGTYGLSIAGTGEDANATGDLDITDSVIIKGAGSGSTIIDGNDVDRVLDIADKIDVGLVGLRITDGLVVSDYGAGIQVGEGGHLALSGVRVDNNRIDNNGNYGAGIFLDDGATLEATASRIDSNGALDPNTEYVYGGGIFADYGAIVTLTDVRIENNQAGSSSGYGGAYYGEYGSILTLVDSTVSGNSANYGGAFYFDYAAAQIRDTEISDNLATGYGGVEYNYESTVEYRRVDFSGNGVTGSGPYGGISYNDYATTVIIDSTIADTTMTATSGSSMYGGLFYVYDGGTTEVINTAITGTTIDRNGNSASLYGGLAYIDSYGRFQLTDSSVTGTTVDADGFYGGLIYNYYAHALVENTTIADSDFDGNTSSVYGGVLYGEYADNAIVGGSISDTTVTTTSSAYGGAGYHYYGGTTIDGTEISGTTLDTTSTADGGGFYAEYGGLTVRNATFDQNVAGTGDSSSGQGGALYLYYAGTEISDSTFTNNSATYVGGAVSAYESGVTVRRSTFTGNRAENTADLTDYTYGGAFGADDYNKMLIEDSVISGNLARGEGGGLYQYDGPVIMRRTVVADNVVDNDGDTGSIYGGGVSTDCYSPLVIEDSQITGNTAVGGGDVYGGGIYADCYNAVQLLRSQVTGNTAESTDATDTYAAYGGGVYLEDNDVPLEAKMSLIAGNTATGGAGGYGGGIYADDQAAVHLENSTLANNVADSGGGGIYSYGGPVRLVYSTVLGNRTLTGGSAGGVYLDGSGDTASLVARGTLFQGNLSGATPRSCNGTGTVVYDSRGHNLSNDATCSLTATGDKQNTNGQAQALADNGGPTLTAALPAASPAVNAGEAACKTLTGATALTHDQRGAGRPASGACDIGAFEYASGVTVAATDAAAAEDGPDTGTFTVARQGTSGALTVKYSVGGTATAGGDYQALSGSVVIPDGAATATITVTPVLDDAVEGPETVVVTLLADAAYPLGVPTSATVTIADHVANGDVTRVAGADRVATAIRVSRAAFDTADTVVLARADNFADALAGAPLAAKLGAPVLLSFPGELATATAAELGRLGAKTVVILGGEAAISQTVVDQLTAIGVTVDRVAGANRYETAYRIADRVGGTEVYIAKAADADNPSSAFVDALGVSAVAAFQQRPILLVADSVLPGPTLDAIADLGVTKATIIGGTGAIDASVEAGIQAAGVTTTRLFGSTRYGTSTAVAAAGIAAGMTAQTVWVASGTNYPDALAAGPTVGALGHTLLLVAPDSLDNSPESRQFLVDQKAVVDLVRIVGGAGAISTTVESQIQAALQ
jgi:CSLREA domain-containing protein